MSIVHIRSALETAAVAISPALDTIFETGVFTLASGSTYPGAYKPQAGRAYQRLYLLPASPDDREIGPGFSERGLFQISLFYPAFAGPGDAQARAELIRAAFYRGRSLSAGGITTQITNVPAIERGMEDGDRFMVPVSIRYRARMSS